MAKRKLDEAAVAAPANGAGRMLRALAEVVFADELEQLVAEDKYERPPGWRMSPRLSSPTSAAAKRGRKRSPPSTSAINGWSKSPFPRW